MESINFNEETVAAIIFPLIINNYQNLDQRRELSSEKTFAGIVSKNSARETVIVIGIQVVLGYCKPIDSRSRVEHWKPPNFVIEESTYIV